MYFLFRNGKGIKKEEWDELNKIICENTCLKIEYEFKERLREIYETSKKIKEGRREIKKLLRTARVFY